VSAVHLNIVANPGANEPEDFELLAQRIRELDSEISVSIQRDEPLNCDSREDSTPQFTLSPGPIQRFRPRRGTVVQGQLLGKSDEYRRLEQAGIPVPKWTLLTPREHPDCSHFGPYVVVKPDRGAQGADVQIARTSRLRWRHPNTRTARILGGLFAPYIVQEFIYTGPWPVSYRVVTLFGHALWCTKLEASHSRPALIHRFGFEELGPGVSVSIVSSGQGCSYELGNDPEVVRLGELAHNAFPDFGLLGVDVLRDAENGELFVAEVNSLGYVWSITSKAGRELQHQFGIDLDSHFGAITKAARILAEKSRVFAS
jgi:hypothetical protein